MARWLFKTEPSEYSLADLENDEETMWDGVTNALALKHLRTVETDDDVLIYHTGDEKAVVGVAEVVRGCYINPDEDDPKLAVCDVRFVRHLERPVTLAQIKATPELASWDLVRNARLSVVPVSDEIWNKIVD